MLLRIDPFCDITACRKLVDRVNAILAGWARQILPPPAMEPWTDVEHDHRVPAGFGGPSPAPG